MDQTAIGKFIAQCRKEQSLTQAQLAQRLHITDRAVSKWETGKSMPDASNMLALCEALGITVNELLSGERLDGARSEKKADENLLALKRRDERSAAKGAVLSVLFSAALALGILVCLICNLAVSGALTWALIPVSSIAFAWVIVLPCLLAGRRGLFAGLLALSVCIFPYLFLLGRLIRVKAVFSVGAAVAAAGLAFLWGVAAVFHRLGRARLWAALGAALLCAVPLVLLINAILFCLLGQPFWDAWDLLEIAALLVLAAVFFLCDHARRKRPTR